MKSMLMRSYLLVCILLPGLFTSCHKDKVDEPPVQGLPVFSISGQLGNEPLSVSAGDDGFELAAFTEYRNGVKVYCGDLNGEQLAIHLKITDGNLDMLGSKFQNNIPSFLKYFQMTNNELLHIAVDQFPNSNYIDEINWFVDGVYSGTDDLHMNTPGVYNVCAQVTFEDGTNATVCNEMIVGYKISAFGAIRHYVDQQGQLKAWIETDTTAIESVTWYVDETPVCESEILLTQLSPEIHTISAEMKFTNGAFRKKTILADGSSNAHFLDDFSSLEFQTYPEFHDFQVILEIVKNGITYSSEITPNQLAEFKVLQVSYFGKNSAGVSVYKIDAHLACNLANSSGQLLPFQGNVSFGITGE